MARLNGLKINIIQTSKRGQQNYQSRWAVSKNEKRRKAAKNNINKENTTLLLCFQPSKKVATTKFLNLFEYHNIASTLYYFYIIVPHIFQVYNGVRLKTTLLFICFYYYSLYHKLNYSILYVYVHYQ